jgi:hypothetical protein
MALRYLRDDGRCSLAEERVSRCSPPVDVVAFENGVRGGDGLTSLSHGGKLRARGMKLVKSVVWPFHQGTWTHTTQRMVSKVKQITPDSCPPLKVTSLAAVALGRRGPD